MELNVAVLCTPTVATGFALAGIGAVESDVSRAAQEISRLCDDARLGVVLVEDTLHRALPADLRARLDRLATPVVVPFPSPTWERRGLAEQYVLDILRQAVGYRVRAP